MLNNVIDCSPPNVTQHPAPALAFEGVTSSHMYVAGLFDGTIVAPVGQNMNAWSLAYQNFGVAVANWPSTFLVSAPPLTARYDLTAIVGAGVTNRNAVLYVNDALRATLGTDHSPHDFRLAPMARPQDSAVPQLNPLVNLGVAIPNTPSLRGRTIQVQAVHVTSRGTQLTNGHRILIQ